MANPREIKVFEASIAEEAEPIPFACRFSRSDDEVEVFEFSANGNPGDGPLMALASMVRYDAQGRQRVDINGVIAFFRRCLSDEDFERFRDMIERNDLKIHIDYLTNVASFLWEKWTGRPLVEQLSSSMQPSVTGRSSTAKPSRTAKTS